MQVKYLCPHWGCEADEANVFMDKVLQAGYEGVEINLPQSSSFTDHFIAELEDVLHTKPGFIFIAQQLTAPENETVDSYINRMEKRLVELAAYQPTFINSHTGKDYFSFDDNCRVIEAAMNISSKTGIRIFYETHRGRFSFHAASLLAYLRKFPELELVGDFSHFCAVSESLLQDQQQILEEIMPHVSHIHARVGSEQTLQVNDPAAPEWQQHLKIFTQWWQQIISLKKEKGWAQMTVTTEFGPAPYMQQLPFSRQPVSNQWGNNIFMMNTLKKNLQT